MSGKRSAKQRDKAGPSEKELDQIRVYADLASMLKMLAKAEGLDQPEFMETTGLRDWARAKLQDYLARSGTKKDG